MAGSKAMKGEIVTTGQENPLGVASELPAQDYPADGSPGKQKIRASEVVIIILLVLVGAVLLLCLHRYRGYFECDRFGLGRLVRRWATACSNGVLIFQKREVLANRRRFLRRYYFGIIQTSEDMFI